MAIRKITQRTFKGKKVNIEAEILSLRGIVGTRFAVGATLAKFAVKECRKATGKETRKDAILETRKLTLDTCIPGDRPNPIELLYSYYWGQVQIKNGSYCVNGKYVGMREIYQLVNNRRLENGDEPIFVPEFFR